MCGAGGGRRAVASGAGATCLATHASSRTVVVARATERIRALTIGSSGTHSGADTAVIGIEIAIKVNITIACITAIPIPVPATVPGATQVNRECIWPMESRQGANVALPSTRQQTQQQARYATHGTRNERQRSAELQRGAHSQGTHHLSVRGLQAQQQCTNSEDAQVEHRQVEGADEEGR